MATRTVWDGKFIRNREATQAAIDAGLGLVQVFAGPRGWQPGYTMKRSGAFPLAAQPVATLASLAPNTAVVNTGTKAVTATGTNFRSTDELLVNGAVFPSVFVNATTRTFTLPATAAAGAVPIRIRDVLDRMTAVVNFTWTATAVLEESAPEKKTKPSKPE